MASQIIEINSRAAKVSDWVFVNQSSAQVKPLTDILAAIAYNLLPKSWYCRLTEDKHNLGN